ncbi:MAG: VCBS repeat-containing protein, partial [Candidatus Hydrogenedentes bacterium]|nr:VCBS repeat-containing protein [Candidatus Hydrogenedentota bacterium]
VIAGSRFYPELVLIPWDSTSPQGIPVFGTPVVVSTPDYVTHASPGIVFERGGEVHALWMADKELVHLRYNRDANAFEETARLSLPELPRSPSCFGVLPDREGDGFNLLFSISDGVPAGPRTEGYGSRDARYDPYDGAGVWRGGFPYATLYAAHVAGLLKGPIGPATQVASTPREVRNTHAAITPVDLGEGRERGVMSGSLYGNFYYYSLANPDTLALAPRRSPAGNDGILLRHPTIRPLPVSFPNQEGRWADLIVGGEGGLYFYRFTGRFSSSGQPIYDDPVPALQRNALLYAGTLPVPNTIDWDGDGDTDIVTGNSEGQVLFIRNDGTDAAPAFLPGVPLEAGGDPICIQAGYSGSIQGPDEARWGYTCPTVCDWNQDGLPDVVMSDATAQHRVYLTEGTATAPQLGFERSLYLDGLELHGTWRVKPAAGLLAGRMAYVCLDDDDEFHLYWQIDAFNLEDGGKLHLDTGAKIGANFLKAGGTGRLKISLYDWDRDGRTDLLVGTPRHASIPDPEKGLPQSLGLPGSAVMLLRNSGSDAAPVFAFPELFTVKGVPTFFGQHACGPAVWPATGEPRGLIVAMENGRFYYFAKEDIRFERITELTSPPVEAGHTP